MNYITKKEIGIDVDSGLSIELRAKELNIDAGNRKITIKIDKCLVSPTGLEMKVIETLYYDRFDTEINKKYTALEESNIGIGIKELLNLDLDLYPNLQQN